MDTSNDGLGAISYERGYIQRRHVVASEIDVLGHVNNAVYVRWLQDIAVSHWHAVTTGPLAEDFYWVCLRHEIDYRVPLLEGDEVELRTWLGARSGAKFDRHVDIRKCGAEKWSAQAKTTWVMIEKASNRPKRVGDHVIEALGLPMETYQAR